MCVKSLMNVMKLTHNNSQEETGTKCGDPTFGSFTETDQNKQLQRENECAQRTQQDHYSFPLQ